MHRARCGEGHGASKPSPSWLLCQYLHIVTNPETFWPPTFWVFREASWQSQGWLHHWPLVNAISSPSPCLEAREWEGSKTKSFYPLITGWILLAASIPPQIESKSHLINITRDTSVTLLTWEIPSVLAMSQKLYEHQIYISYYISQYIYLTVFQVPLFCLFSGNQTSRWSEIQTLLQHHWAVPLCLLSKTAFLDKLVSLLSSQAHFHQTWMIWRYRIGHDFLFFLQTNTSAHLK